MEIETHDLHNRFRHHPPKDDKTALQYETNREKFLELASYINSSCPNSREKSLAITRLEEAMFWTNASIARN